MKQPGVQEALRVLKAGRRRRSWLRSSTGSHATREYLDAESANDAAFETRVEARLDDLAARFDRLESRLGASSGPNDAPER